MNLIFVISLPRSGSTLLQRLLLSSNSISTAAEPWICLPLCNLLNHSHTTISRHGTEWQNQALNEFYEDNNVLKSCIKNFLIHSYKSRFDYKNKYFLDKTPRYYEIIDELHELFPEAKFVILTRDPLEIIKSCLKTWGNKKYWNLYNSKADFFIGIPKISKFLYKNISSNNVFHIHYDDINKESRIKELSSFLDISIGVDNLKVINNFQISGKLGDPSSHKKFDGFKKSSSDNLIFCSILRKIYLKNLFKSLGDENLFFFRTKVSKISEDLNNYRNFSHLLFFDMFFFFYGYLCETLNLKHIISNLKKKSSKRFIYR